MNNLIPAIGTGKFLCLRNSLLSIAAIIAFSGLTFGQTYSGEAMAVKATVTVPLTPVLTAAVNDTGPLATSGGTINLSSANATVPNILNVALSTVSTTGGSSLSQSNASVANLDTTLAGFGAALVVTADTVTSATHCVCPNSITSGSSVIQNLRIGGNLVAVTGAVNETFVVTVGNVTLTLVVNEHFDSPGSKTVNGLHIRLVDSLTGAATDIVVASSYSEITCVFAPPFDRFKGRGTGTRLQLNTLLVPSSTSTIVSDSGHLPTNGGNVFTSTAGVNVLGLISTGVVTSRTSGGVAGGNADTTQSDSTVNNLGVTLIGGVSLNATLLRSNTQCQCSVTNVASCSGGSQVTNLTASVLGIPVIINVTGNPNQIVFLPGVGTLVINEQIPASPTATMTVNALHVFLNVPLTATSDVAVASSHSGIQCGITITAADVSISGRVTDSNGRGISKAKVSATDQTGSTVNAVTNAFGYYRIENVSVGASYMVNVGAKRYSFHPRVITVDDHLTGLDFEAVPSESAK